MERKPYPFDKRQNRLNLDLNRWLIRLRWWVPPTLFLGTLIANRIGYEFIPNAMFILAFAIFAYNLIFLFAWKSSFNYENKTADLKNLAYWQIGADYAALIFLVQFTGGSASPFIFFFLFHIILASILLSARTTYAFAGLASLGMIVVAAAEYLKWIPHHGISFMGRTIDLAHQPAHMLVELTFFSVAILIAAFLSTHMMAMLRNIIPGRQYEKKSGYSFSNSVRIICRNSSGDR